MRDNVQVAIIHPSHAQIGHREAIYANFLRSGPHWQHVADVLRAAEPELVATWKREQEAKRGALAAMATAEAERESAATRRIDTLPGHLGPELTGACLNASRRIRLDRQVAYDRPVVLESSAGELTLLPIGATHTRLLMPFRLAKGTETLRGQLILGDRDPLPLLVGADVTDDEAVSAWAYALLGFADATCIELEARGPITHRLPTPERRPSSPVSGGHQTRTLPRRGPWPRQLEPVGHWIRYSGAFVAGH